jgi:DNA-binding PadR family transcriptional regulator
MEELTGFQRDLLYVVGGLDEPSGLEVKREIEDYYRREVSSGHLYPNLNELVDDGLVHKSAKDGRTNVYSLTERGSQVVDERRQWERERLPGVVVDW